MTFNLQVVRRSIADLASRMLGTVINISTSHPVVALTFDDGPHPQFTPQLLEILERHQAKATFFMVGESAQRYPEILEKVAHAGHAIGNHSWDHPSFPLISCMERHRQIKDCMRALAPHGLRLFRPPFGHQNISTRLYALLFGYQVVGWDILTDDWLNHDAHWLYDRVEEQIKPGSIILFHDSLSTILDGHYESREPTIAAVDMILRQLSGRFRFVTVPELFRYGRPHRVNSLQKGQANWLNQLQEPGGRPWRHRPEKGFK